jgi:hypothetical protein
MKLGFPWDLPGITGEHFRVFSAVVLGQYLARLARPVRNRALTDLAAHYRKLRDGYREAAGTWITHHYS